MSFGRTRDFFIGDPDITRLNSLNFCDFVNSNDMALIMFYDPNCVESQDARGPFRNTIDRTDRPNVAYGAVNCNKSQYLCYTQGVIQEPIFRVYSRGSVLHTFEPSDYYTASKFAEFLDDVPIPRGASTPYATRVL